MKLSSLGLVAIDFRRQRLSLHDSGKEGLRFFTQRSSKLRDRKGPETSHFSRHSHL